MAETELEMVSMDSARSRLAKIWLSLGAVIFGVVIMQSFLGRYEDKTVEAWNWLLPTIMPTLGLIIAVLTSTARDAAVSQAAVRKSFVQIVTWLSVAYLGLVLVTIAAQPFVARDAAQALALMRGSNLWLGPFQGLVASALGVLFVTKKEGATPAHKAQEQAAGS